MMRTVAANQPMVMVVCKKSADMSGRSAVVCSLSTADGLLLCVRCLIETAER